MEEWNDGCYLFCAILVWLIIIRPLVKNSIARRRLRQRTQEAARLARLKQQESAAREYARIRTQEEKEAARQEREKKRRDAQLQKLGSDAAIAEVDLEYLAPLLEKQQARYEALRASIELYESVTAAPEMDRKAFEKAAREYYATSKRFIKALNTIQAFADARG